MSDEPNANRKRFGYFAILLTLVIGFLGGGLAVAGAAAYHMHHHFGGPGMVGMHGLFGLRHMRHGGNIQDATEMAQFMTNRFADRIGATDEQRKGLLAISNTAAKDLMPMMEKFRDLHKRAHQLFLQPTIDKSAVEALRVEHMLLVDEASKKVVGSLTDAAILLTPEQRAKLAKRWED